MIARPVILGCLLYGACSNAESSSLALQVAANNAQTAEPNIPSVAAKRADLPTVLILGDNIGAGQYLSEQQAFPSVLERELRGRAVVINASQREDATADGLRRLDALLGLRPDVVVVELGEQDKRLAVPVREVEANLRTILTKVQAAGAKALLLAVSNEPDRQAERALGSAYARELAAVYERVGAELAVPVVSFLQGVAGRRELTLPDGVHPTPEGHVRIAGNLLEPVRRLVAP